MQRFAQQKNCETTHVTLRNSPATCIAAALRDKLLKKLHSVTGPLMKSDYLTYLINRAGKTADVLFCDLLVYVDEYAVSAKVLKVFQFATLFCRLCRFYWEILLNVMGILSI